MASTDSLERRLTEALVPDCALSAEQIQQLATYLSLLKRWNKVHNLTAVRDTETMIQRHLVESLAMRGWLEGDRCCDAGSGAGLPGLPLAIAQPQRHFVLVERAGKKAAFLEHVAQQLQLTNLEVVHSDLQDYQPTEGFATVVARALAPLPRLVPLVAHLLSQTGRLIALKGPAVEEELAALPPGFELTAMETLPLGGRDSRVVVIAPQQEQEA